MEYKSYRIQDLVDIRRGASPRPIKDFISTDPDFGFSWVKIADATKDHSRFLSHTKEYVSPEGAAKSVAVYKGDLILSNSATPGLPKIMNKKAYIHDGWLLIRNFQGVNRDYLYYLFLFKRQELLQLSNGSVFNNLKTDIVKNFTVDIPSLNYQNRVEHVLTSIDAKIEVNNKLIANLEELSQTLFKRWFVDFEFPDEEGNPYKSNGGKFINSELGQIPMGWNIRELKDIAHIVMGQSPKSDTYNYEKDGLPLINGATDFNHGIINPTKYTTDPKKVGSQNDYIFGVRATIGRVTELDSEYAIGRGAGIASPINEFYREYLYQILNKAFKEFSNTASGSVYLNVSRIDLISYNIIIPTDDILRAFHSLTNSYLKDISLLKLENKNLTELRDTLLPKLMSGEIELPDELEVDEHAELL